MLREGSYLRVHRGAPLVVCPACFLAPADEEA